MIRINLLSSKTLLSCVAIGTILFLFYANTNSNGITNTSRSGPEITEEAKSDAKEYKYIDKTPPPVIIPKGSVISSNNQMEMVSNDSLAEYLQQKVRVLCWIAVTESTVDRARVIQQTWGRRCTELVLIGDDSTSKYEDIVTLNVPKGRNKLWDKTKEAFNYVYQNYFDKADWFMKADTDTYVIMENLRHLLSLQDRSIPAYIGCNIKLYIPKGYNSGGAGYVLNQKSLELLVNEAYKISRCNDGYMEDEDVSMGFCMSQVGVFPGDPTDKNDKNRFFPFEPADHVSPAPYGANGWYWRATYKPGEKNLNCCSDTWISFHYVSSQLLWNMEFLLYHSKVFGVTTSLQPANQEE